MVSLYWQEQLPVFLADGMRAGKTTLSTLVGFTHVAIPGCVRISLICHVSGIQRLPAGEQFAQHVTVCIKAPILQQAPNSVLSSAFQNYPQFPPTVLAVARYFIMHKHQEDLFAIPSNL